MLSGHALDEDIDDGVLEDIELLELLKLTDESLDTSEALLAISDESLMLDNELLRQSQQAELELETIDTADCTELLNFSGANGTLLIVLISLFAEDFVGFLDDDLSDETYTTELEEK